MVQVYYLIDKNNLRYPLEKKEYDAACELFDGANDNTVIKVVIDGSILRMRAFNIAVLGESTVAKEKDDLLKPLPE